MNSILRNALAVIAGFFIGCFVNGGIISFYPSLFPLPEEVLAWGLVGNTHLLELPHFISIFLAHGLGTLVEAFLAAKIAVSKQLFLSMTVGVLFLLAGIAVNAWLNFSPLSFSIIDITLAYIPMAWIGWKLAPPLKRKI